jgi:uncharacterized membrane protein YgcG
VVFHNPCKTKGQGSREVGIILEVKDGGLAAHKCPLILSNMLGCILERDVTLLRLKAWVPAAAPTAAANAAAAASDDGGGEGWHEVVVGAVWRCLRSYTLVEGVADGFVSDRWANAQAMAAASQTYANAEAVLLKRYADGEDFSGSDSDVDDDEEGGSGGGGSGSGGGGGGSTDCASSGEE